MTNIRESKNMENKDANIHLTASSKEKTKRCREKIQLTKREFVYVSGILLTNNNTLEYPRIYPVNNNKTRIRVYIQLTTTTRVPAYISS